MASAVKRIEECITPTLDELGYELVDIEIGKENGNKILFVYIYHNDGIGLDDCETVSRAIDPLIDELNPIQDSYYLCVSSPDLERPLKKPRDFERNIGNEVEIRLYQARDKQKRFEGELVGFDAQDESITIQYEGNEMAFTLKEISKVKPLIRLLEEDSEVF